jgi:hypothetical protein
MTPGRRPAPGVFCWTERRAEEGGAVRITLLIVFGALGTLARYGLQGLVQERTGPSFPAGTLVVNILGCFLLGGIAEYALTHLSVPPEWRIGITVGFHFRGGALDTGWRMGARRDLFAGERGGRDAGDRGGNAIGGQDLGGRDI